MISRHPLLLAVLFVSVVRAVVLWLWWDDLDSDPDAYRSLAITLAETGVYGNQIVDGAVVPSAFRPPLYPWFLSWFVSEGKLSSLPIGIAHWVMGIATCVMTGSIARKLCAICFVKEDASCDRTLGPSQGIGHSNTLQPTRNRLVQNQHNEWISYAAMLLVACDPILLRQSTLTMTETMATFLASATWWLWLQIPTRFLQQKSPQKFTKQAVIAFITFAFSSVASSYCRPTALATSVFVLVCLASCFFKYRMAWAISLALVSMFAIGLAPWVLRNQVQLGKPIVATTHGGYTLLLANNPIIYEHFRESGDRDWDESAFQKAWNQRESENSTLQNWSGGTWIAKGDGGLSLEIRDDQNAGNAAKQTIQSNPLLFLKSCVIRVGWLWAIWPDDRQAGSTLQILIGVFFSMTYTFAIVGCVSLARAVIASDRSWSRTLYWNWIPAISLLASVTIVHSVYWSNMRMRSVVVPVVAIAAATGVAQIASLVRASKRSS